MAWGPFCQYIETRQGLVLNDYVLDRIRPHDVSIPIFIIIWSVAGLTIRRTFSDADLFIRLLWAYSFIFISRVFTISLVPLNPPRGLLELIDPLSNLFYGSGAPFITKDLFYSGHTSILVLMALCLKKPIERRLALLGAGTVGGLLLVQHVHYTVDVLAAPFFSYAAYTLAGRLMAAKLPQPVMQQQNSAPVFQRPDEQWRQIDTPEAVINAEEMSVVEHQR